MQQVANLGNKTMMQKNLKNDWNPGTYVLLYEYSARAIQWIPLQQGSEGFKKLGVLLLWKVNPFMLRLLLSMGEKCKKFWKPSKPCLVGIHWKAIAEYYQMSTHVPWFQVFCIIFVLTKLAASSQRVKDYGDEM